jgi:hypothetical protein
VGGPSSLVDSCLEQNRKNHFFLPLALPLTGAWLEAVDMTLEALEEGVADVALLPTADLTLSSALFC